ncbi:vexin [Heliangelus exortis]|uniref:vexin n=1 Tax=Heliangelus exortis TaxID=472823 RepID=UPI003A953F4C
MHQIYSCSDENLEVFTTVISSKSCSPARRRAKSTQHILARTVIVASDHRPHRTEKLQPHQGDLLRVLYSEDKVPGLGHQQQGPCPTKGTAQHMGIAKQESSKSCSHMLNGKSWLPPSPVAHITTKAVAVTDPSTTPTDEQRWKKTAEYDLALPPGAEASLPLTGGNLCGTPSLLRKMWMKHKKKSEYLGATNSAFEAD